MLAVQSLGQLQNRYPNNLWAEIIGNCDIQLMLGCTDDVTALSIAQRSGATSLIFMNAAECTPDKQFRFGLTPFLLQYAGIDREVMIVGRAGQAEIWDVKEFEAFEAENLTPEKLLASLEAIGL